MDPSAQVEEILSTLHSIRRQNDAILHKLDAIMSDLNQVQSGTFASYVVNTLHDIDFMLKH